MSPREGDKRSRRNVLKLSGSTLATTGILFGFTSSASARSQLEFDPYSQEETIEFIKYLAELPKKEGKRTWKKLDEDQRNVIEEFVDVDQITHKVYEKDPEQSRGISTNSSYQTEEITHTVTSTTEVPYAGWDLVDIWEFEQDVVWDYNGDEYENVNHSDSANILFPQISFWTYQGVQNQNIGEQASWADATMSGQFEFRFFEFGDLVSETGFSGVRVYPDGTWEVTEERISR